MKDRAEIIANILNTILNSGDIDGSILKLSNSIDSVTYQTAQPQTAICQAAYSQETQLP
jgi:hypothetical protein